MKDANLSNPPLHQVHQGYNQLSTPLATIRRQETPPPPPKAREAQAHRTSARDNDLLSFPSFVPNEGRKTSRKLKLRPRSEFLRNQENDTYRDERIMLPVLTAFADSVAVNGSNEEHDSKTNEMARDEPRMKRPSPQHHSSLVVDGANPLSSFTTSISQTYSKWSTELYSAFDPAVSSSPPSEDKKGRK